MPMAGFLLVGEDVEWVCGILAGLQHTLLCAF